MNALFEGIRNPNKKADHTRMLNKWRKTGLLEGLSGERAGTMAVMLENQARALLAETNSQGGLAGTASDVQGFQNIAFPMVRRVFAGLLANELVSVQPMSLPSGLLFYLDYRYGSARGMGAGQGGNEAPNDSIYGSPIASELQAGGASGSGGPYDLLGAGYSRRNVVVSGSAVEGDIVAISGAVTWAQTDFDPALASLYNLSSSTDLVPGLFVVALSGSSTQPGFFFGSTNAVYDESLVTSLFLYSGSVVTETDESDDEAGSIASAGTMPGAVTQLRRLNKLATGITIASQVGMGEGADRVHVYLTGSYTNFQANAGWADGSVAGANRTVDNDIGIMFPVSENLIVDGNTAAVSVAPAFESDFGTLNEIPEINIRINSVSVVSETRKLKAVWTPELAQDLNAYHNLDAEVELTQILSEQVALEIDREILGDLLNDAVTKRFWSRAPGKFVDKTTGVIVTDNNNGPRFTGTVREWYETLVETVIDCANEIHRLTLRGAANFLVCGPEIATILEASVVYKPSLSGFGNEGMKMTIGAEKLGTLNNRFTVYKDPYFPRQKILVGYKGKSFLETGFVYAPYVPLITTPTIFEPDDFTPRKGIMTRYGKKMVRPDFYGVVTVLDLNII